MSRKALQVIPLLVIVALVVAMLPTAVPAAQAQDKTKIVWFVGLGAGGQPEQIEAEEAVVTAFNNSHDDIELEIVIVDNNVAPDTLSTLIASGEAPDLVGPVGRTGSNRFGDAWLDILPLVESTGYDLGQYPAAAVENYRTPDGGLVGLPFAIFPSFMWYRPGLFEEAGLEMPPTAYGEPYMLDGEEVPWNWDTIREIAMILTVDANGYDATEPEFDADNTIQWGYAIQWSDPRGVPTHFGSGHVYNAETGEAYMPDNWREGWNWIYDAIWVDNFYPNDAEVGSDLLGGSPFPSGNLAMTTTHLWFTCCVEDTEWQAAPMPANSEGVVTAKMHGDTFRIHKDTKNPEAAFEVMTYLLGPAAQDLFAVYGGFPSRPEEQPAYFEFLNEKYTQGVNWDVVVASQDYADNPSHEAWMPNFNKAEDLLQNFVTLYGGTPGLDMDAELDQLVEDLQAVFDEVE